MKPQDELLSIGKRIDHIDVRISHRIIQLFSEGLYSSPNKAIEELISNSFDAGAENVLVILSPDLTEQNATIAVIDDGEGMNADALKRHWIIGRSMRRELGAKRGRKPIGKFGIGKLATYVLANQLTHVCKSDGKFYAATMDYTGLSKDEEQGGVFDEKKIPIPLRELTEQEAAQLLEPWITGEKPGYKAMRLFGNNAVPSWTAAILSDLKPMGRRIQRGKLRWILSTAMPLRDDFKLFLNGEPIESSKIDEPLVGKWIIGKDIKEDTLGKPCPDGFEVTEDNNFPKDSVHHYGLSHPDLGRITGFIELYKNDISRGKSAQWGRSHGFFVYVRGRLLNTGDDDDGFGIPRNQLRHGTFTRFRMIVHIDKLDETLRSSRETLQEGELYNLARDFLRASFNFARKHHVEFEKDHSPGVLLTARISSAPGSLTRKPLFALALQAIDGKVRPLYMRLPEGLSDAARQELLEQIHSRDTSEEGILQATELVPLDSKEGVAIYEVHNNRLLINESHPFVASFQELYTKADSSMPLEMYAMAEVLTEAYLYHLGVREDKIRDILAQRDDLLRYLVRSSAHRTPGMIALALLDAKNNPNRLEEEMRAAFEALGFENVIRIGGSGKPDGTAEANLPASENGIRQRYKVCLEAKSGGKVSAHRLDVSAIERHMEDYGCDHCVVIGNGFETATRGKSASERSIERMKSRTDKTITMMYIDDLARLVRLMPAKRIDLKKLREMFQSCITPEQSKEWINKIAEERHPPAPYKEILEAIWKRAKERDDEPIEYAAVLVELEHWDPAIKISKQDLISYCKAMQAMAPGVVFARETTVEITLRPDLVLKDIQDTIRQYPEEERKTIVI